MLVFPCPLRPTNEVTPGSSSTSRREEERKSCRGRWATYKRLGCSVRYFSSAGEATSEVVGGPSAWTAWPPNWLRIAETAFIAGLSCWRELNRAHREAAT